MQTNLLLNLIVNGINDGRAQGMNLEEHARLCWPWREKRNEKSVCERERETEGIGEGITRYKLACQGKTYGTSYTVI